MCRLIAELTNTDYRSMSSTLKRLEQRSAMPGVDVRLTSDIRAKIHLKIRALGLDPHDTTPRELYVALQNMAAVHDGFFRKKFGIGAHTSVEQLVQDSSHIYQRLRFNRRCWLVRHSVIRRILKAHPPKTLLKELGYRTADSLIKREPADVLFFLALYFESPAWQQQLDKHIKKLTAVDFEERLLEVQTLEAPRYRELVNRLTANYHTLVFGVPVLGTVFILPSPIKVRPGMLLLTVMMSLKEATELQYVHSYLRHHQMEGSFGAKLVEGLRRRTQRHFEVAGHSIGWHLVHRHYGSGDSSRHPNVFQPHLQSDDLAYRRAEEILYRVEPALHFWHGLEYVGLPVENSPISFNLLDVLINLVNGLPLESRHHGHLAQSVWDELLLRYLKQPAIERLVVNDLSESAYSPIMHEIEFAAL